MPHSGRLDARIITTGPADLEDLPGVPPFELDRPEDLVFCCFFKDLESRAEFLAALRSIAAKTADQDASPEATPRSEQYARAERAGDSVRAFSLVMRWWTGELCRGYHAYSLKIALPPYRTSCLIAFREHDAESIRRHVDRALRHLEQDRARVIDFFGFPGARP